MKRTYLWLAGTLMSLSTFTACTNEADDQNLPGELKQIVATAKNFVPEAESRAFSLVNNSVEFAWADGDTIGIFPNTGAQAYFPILAESAGTNTASFTGGGWALKSSSTYAAYYPFIGDFYMSQKEIPVNYEGQKQTGNASMTHLSAYDFMAASGSTPSSGKVNFQFAHLGAFVQLKITMPQGGTLASVTLSADQAVFTTEGTIDLTAAIPAIKSVKKSKTLTLDVENITTTAESNVATLYMMLAPVDFTNRTLSAIVKTSNGSTETITLTGKNFEAGKAYGVTGTMKDPNGGAVAGNGTYKDGVVSIATAGTMKKLLGDDYLNITSLKVVGPINGDDIYYLAKMLGRGDFSKADWGKLTTLDLSNATIVEGGEWYTNRYGEEYTSYNVIGKYMFCECANLQNISLPDNIISIGTSAFSICDALTKVTIKDLSSWCKIKFQSSSSNPLCNEAKLFLNDKEITQLMIPEDISVIKEYTFHGCESITSVAIHDGVTSIGNSAFSNCHALTEVTIPDGVTSIGEYAFYNCDALTEVIIGNGVTEIGSSTFNDCEALTEVTIGDGVTVIGQHAFLGCSINMLYCYATKPPTLDGKNSYHPLFNGVKTGATLYVPARCGAAYKSSSWGDYFKNIVEMD